MCLGNSLFVAFLLVVMLGSLMTALEAVQASGYGLLAALQLLFMHTNRELYQRHRFKVRQGCVCWPCVRYRQSACAEQLASVLCPDVLSCTSAGF